MNGTTYRMRYIFEDGTWHNSDFVYDKDPLSEVQKQAERIANSGMKGKSGSKLVEVMLFSGDEYGFPKTHVSSHRPNEKVESVKPEYSRHLASERIRGHLFLDCAGKNKNARDANIRRAAMQLYYSVSDIATSHHWMQGFFNEVSHASVVAEISGNCDGANIIPKTDIMKTFKRWCFQQMDYAHCSPKWTSRGFYASTRSTDSKTATAASTAVSGLTATKCARRSPKARRRARASCSCRRSTNTRATRTK